MDRLTLITLAAHQPNRAIRVKPSSPLIWCAACLPLQPQKDIGEAYLMVNDQNLGDECFICARRVEFHPN